MKRMLSLIAAIHSLVAAIAVTFTLALLFSPTPASAEPWFLHHFGELRAYHGDWLAVCRDRGRGDCRTVQIVLEPDQTFFGQSRLSLKRRADGGYAIDVFDRGMPSEGHGPIVFTFDGVALELKPDQWRKGDSDSVNVSENMAITDPDLSADLVRRMKAGRELVVSYKGGDATFSLRGVTASLGAIEKTVANREE